MVMRLGKGACWNPAKPAWSCVSLPVMVWAGLLLVLGPDLAQGKVGVMHYGSFGGLSITCQRDELILMESETLGYSADENSCEPRAMCSVPYTLAKWYCRGKSTCAGMQVERRPLHRRTCGAEFTNCLRVEYSCVKRSSLTSVCGDLFMQTTEGYVATPLFPEMYPPDQNCTCRITAQPGDTIQMNTAFFLLKAADPCDDYMLMKMGNGPWKMMCGYNPEETRYEQQEISIRFISDARHQEMGFWLNYISKSNRPATVRCGKYAYEEPPTLPPIMAAPPAPTTPVTTSPATPSEEVHSNLAMDPDDIRGPDGEIMSSADIKHLLGAMAGEYYDSTAYEDYMGEISDAELRALLAETGVSDVADFADLSIDDLYSLAEGSLVGSPEFTPEPLGPLKSVEETGGTNQQQQPSVIGQPIPGLPNGVQTSGGQPTNNGLLIGQPKSDQSGVLGNNDLGQAPIVKDNAPMGQIPSNSQPMNNIGQQPNNGNRQPIPMENNGIDQAPMNAPPMNNAVKSQTPDNMVGENSVNNMAPGNPEFQNNMFKQWLEMQKRMQTTTSEPPTTTTDAPATSEPAADVPLVNENIPFLHSVVQPYNAREGAKPTNMYNYWPHMRMREYPPMYSEDIQSMGPPYPPNYMQYPEMEPRYPGSDDKNSIPGGNPLDSATTPQPVDFFAADENPAPLPDPGKDMDMDMYYYYLGGLEKEADTLLNEKVKQPPVDTKLDEQVAGSVSQEIEQLESLVSDLEQINDVMAPVPNNEDNGDNRMKTTPITLPTTTTQPPTTTSSTTSTTSTTTTTTTPTPSIEPSTQEVETTTSDEDESRGFFADTAVVLPPGADFTLEKDYIDSPVMITAPPPGPGFKSHEEPLDDPIADQVRLQMKQEVLEFRDTVHVPEAEVPPTELSMDNLLIDSLIEDMEAAELLPAGDGGRGLVLGEDIVMGVSLADGQGPKLATGHFKISAEEEDGEFSLLDDSMDVQVGTTEPATTTGFVGEIVEEDGQANGAEVTMYPSTTRIFEVVDLEQPPFPTMVVRNGGQSPVAGVIQPQQPDDQQTDLEAEGELETVSESELVKTTVNVTELQILYNELYGDAAELSQTGEGETGEVLPFKNIDEVPAQIRLSNPALYEKISAFLAEQGVGVGSAGQEGQPSAAAALSSSSGAITGGMSSSAMWVLVVIAVVGWVIFVVTIGILVYYKRDRLCGRRRSLAKQYRNNLPQHLLFPHFHTPPSSYSATPPQLKTPGGAPGDLSTQTSSFLDLAKMLHADASRRHRLDNSDTDTMSSISDRPLPPLPPGFPFSLTSTLESHSTQTTFGENVCTQTDKSSATQTYDSLRKYYYESLGKAMGLKTKALGSKDKTSSSKSLRGSKSKQQYGESSSSFEAIELKDGSKNNTLPKTKGKSSKKSKSKSSSKESATSPADSTTNTWSSSLGRDPPHPYSQASTPFTASGSSSASSENPSPQSNQKWPAGSSAHCDSADAIYQSLNKLAHKYGVGHHASPETNGAVGSHKHRPLPQAHKVVEFSPPPPDTDSPPVPPRSSSPTEHVPLPPPTALPNQPSPPTPPKDYALPLKVDTMTEPCMPPVPPVKDFLLDQVVGAGSSSTEATGSGDDNNDGLLAVASDNISSNNINSDTDDVLLNNLTGTATLERKKESASRMKRLIPQEAQMINNQMRTELSKVFEEIQQRKERNPAVNV